MAVFSWLSKQSRFEKAAEKYRPTVTQINELGEEFKSLSDDELKTRITKWRGKDVKTLRDNQVEIFAAIREAAERTLSMRHFDVQLMGGMALLDNRITEMKTGEGKTLVATAPLILHGLTERGAHLVTVNDYLAARDAEWMRPLYEFFGLSVGVAVPGMSADEKRAAYAADITYATNNELGFDYLRDNMAQRVEDIVMRPLNFVIVDEVDSILIDEARTPLIISAPDAESTAMYDRFSKMVPQLKEGDHYNIDEKRRAATLTDDGTTKVEQLLGVDNVYAEGGIRLVHHLEQALRAKTLYHKDKDYVVKDGQVIIVDEFTGRMMEGRRYSEGLHQAIEAKESVKVQQESRTLATITFQNFFRLYDSLAGMTGTAVTSAEEFEQVYNADVMVMPTNKVLIRNDKTDRIYIDEKAKFKAVAEEIKVRQKKGQPVLVGTIAIEKSEYLSALLQREGVPHEVLNAKHHAREAEIVGKAGQLGAVTISTNMAGRGTDIKLGEGVADRGGLFVLGTERHEARRIDNQLRGRSGRQGDPGETQFFVSLEDDVMRVFGGEKMKNIMERLKIPEGEAIENKLVSRALEGAQERVEGYYFDMRKQVLSYDDVLNRQRKAIYTLRRGVLEKNMWRETGEDDVKLHDKILDLADEQADGLVDIHTGEGDSENWDSEEIAESLAALTGQEVGAIRTKLSGIIKENKADGPEVTRDKLSEEVGRILTSRIDERAEEFSADVLGQLEKAATMRAIDVHWMEHLDTMDYLRTGIGLRGYGQRDPLVEYQKEGYLLFQKLLGTIKASAVETVMRAEPSIRQTTAPTDLPEQKMSGGQEGSNLHQLAGAGPAKEGQPAQPKEAATTNNEPIKNVNKDIGRNDPCPCGSGKKFKKCGMINAPEHKG